MNSFLHRWLVLVLSLVGFRCAAAGLNWETREQHVNSTAGTETVSVKFPFVNSGSAPVSITNIDTGCTCTSAKPSKSVYASGEHGEIAVDFAVGGRVGRQERLITVTTNEPDAATQELRLLVDIAELVSAKPRLIFWAVGEPATEKTATITLTRPAQTKLQPPTSTSPDFTARIEPTEKPEIFLLRLTPTKVTAPANGIVRIEAIIDGKTQILSVFTAVR